MRGRRIEMEEARRSEESKSRGRFARGRAHARWGSEAEGGTRLHRRNALGRTGQDGPREKRGRDIGRREQDGWTDARKARANLFALFGGRDRRLVSIRCCRSDINVCISHGIIPK